MNEPGRLADKAHEHGAAGAGVQALLDLDPDYDVSAGLARFESAVQVEAAPAPAPAKLGLVKGLLLIAIVGAVIAAVVASTSNRSSPPPKSAAAAQVEELPPQRSPPSTPDKSRSVAPEAAVPSAAAPVPEAAEPPTSATGRRRPKATRSEPSVASPVATEQDDGSKPAPIDDSFAREMKLLNKTRKQVRAGDAAAALASIKIARREFSSSTFDEEWDALQIIALADAGRLSAAQARAKAFLAAHPGGRFNTKIRQSLDAAKKDSPTGEGSGAP